MDVHALLRRVRGNEKDRRIAKAMRLSRNTVKKYREWFAAEQLLAGPLPDLAELHQRLRATLGDGQPRQNHSSIEAYRAEIQMLLEQGLSPRLIFQKLNDRPEFTASESAVYRLCHAIKGAQPPEVCVRIETPPGEVAQVDFGEVSRLFDPVTQTLRRTYAFVMVLAWSRHMFVEFVFDQTLKTWLLCHQHAFEFFGGVPKRVVLDNLKAAIIQAYTREKRNVLLCGPTGVGKSHLAQALAHSACRCGFDVVFTNAHTMLRHLNAGRADDTYERRLAGYVRSDLLVIDDFGLKPLVSPAPEDL